MAVQKPASNAVVTHVARKYSLVYKFANGSGDSNPTTLAKLREAYRDRQKMMKARQVVSRLERN